MNAHRVSEDSSCFKIAPRVIDTRLVERASARRSTPRSPLSTPLVTQRAASLMYTYALKFCPPVVRMVSAAASAKCFSPNRRHTSGRW